MTSPFVSQDLYLNNIGLDGTIKYSGGTSSTVVSSVVIHVTGTNYTYQTVNNGNTISRSNSGVAMFDTLPQAKSVVYYPNGWNIWIENSDATANLTITPTTSTINGLTTLVLAPGVTTRIVSDGTNYYAFVTSSSSAGVVAGSNITITPVGGNSQISLANPLNLNNYGIISVTTPTQPITIGTAATIWGDTLLSYSGVGSTPDPLGAISHSHVVYNFNLPHTGASSYLTEENGLFVYSTVPNTGSAYSYEKGAFLAIVNTNDPSPDPSVIFKESVAITGIGMIPPTNSYGLVWGGLFEATIESGGDGLLCGVEIDMTNAGSDVQPGQPFNKLALNIGNLGPNHCSGAISINNSSTGQWHKGIFSTPSTYVTDDPGASAFEIGIASYSSGTTTIMRIDPTGYIGIGTMGIGQTFLNAATPIAVTTNVASYRGSSNVCASFAVDSANAGIVVGTSSFGTPFVGTSLTSTSVGQSLDLQAGGGLVMRCGYFASTVNYIEVFGSTTGSPLQIQSRGTDTNISLFLESKGTGNVTLLTNSVVALIATSPASSVNYIQVQGSTTGNPCLLEVTGTDTNVGLNLQTKGTGAIQLAPGNLGGLSVQATASSVNYLSVTPSITGNPPIIKSVGSDANVGLTLQTTGTGSVNLVAPALVATPATPASQAFGAVTANGMCGFLTFTTSLAAATSASAVISNSSATAQSNIYLTIRHYSGVDFTNGLPYVRAEAETSGSWTLVLDNLHTINALAGTIQISFLVIN